MDPLEISALGGAGSALVAAASYWAKTNHDRRRATRAVLYYLLELHHVLYRVRAAGKALESELVAALNVACEVRAIRLDQAELLAAVAKAKPILNSFGRRQIEAMVAASAGAFEKALADLARENPVLAFRLRGRDQVTMLHQKLQSFFGGEQGGVLTDVESSAAQWAQIDELFDELAIEELRSAIRATAWGCDVVTHIKT
jgi:hypothetical protein